ncbi:MAG: preprotein translocase subunit SecG [Desulfobulbaceae bacterium]|uniref:Protein-export membrane protein SecG n=1 Tax=Candidatus Desulfobia pelagia TaxID=2841692 RepID=A0A8J6NFQ7_9BACT|nr:preprotein translocase subunit SecG [Candidatus Desulfobia pelagia]
MTTLLTVIHISVCFFLIVIVLLQSGKGAAMGATFGGSSQTMFGSEGPLPLLNKVTTSAAVIFMVTSISLAYISAHRSTSSIMSDVEVPKPTGVGIERAMEKVPDMPLQSADAPLTSAPAPVSQETAQGMIEEIAPVEIPAEVEAVVEEIQEKQGEAIPAQQ